METSIGWVARCKATHCYAGYGARCKVFSSKGLAFRAARRWHRLASDAEVLECYDIVEVFATFP